MPPWPSWHAAYTDPLCERLADRRLREAGYATYLPMERYSDARHRVAQRPLFSRYLFVMIDRTLSQTAHRVNKTRGVRTILADLDGRPLPIRADIIAELMRVESIGAFDTTHMDTRLKPGDEVRVEGPLADLAARIVQTPRRDRVRVLYSDILGRSVVVDVPLASVTRLS